MSDKDLAKNAIKASAWYLRIGAFVLTIVMGFSLALYPMELSEARAVSQEAFAQDLNESDYKALLSEPTVTAERLPTPS